jgi:DNA-binding transcriptional MocR family regulator
LAARLGVNPNTVAAAYRILRERGVIETAGRRGSRVRPKPATTGREELRVEPPPGGRDLSTGNPDPALLPRRPAVSITPRSRRMRYAAATVLGFTPRRAANSRMGGRS